MKSRLFKAMQEFAKAVGLSIRREFEADGLPSYWLLDGKGERLVMEYDSHDMVDSIAIYAGSHPNFSHARAQFNYMTGEDS